MPKSPALGSGLAEVEQVITTSLSDPGVRCRPIGREDLAGVEACLIRNFSERTPEFWRNALARLSERAPVGDFPRYGFCLAKGNEIVGVLLQIHSTRAEGDRTQVLCHLSSWCVDAEYRFMAPALSMSSARRKDVTYVNISPAVHTRRAIEAMGYKRHARGQVVFLPRLSSSTPGARVKPFKPNSSAALALPPEEREILADHQAFGCRAFVGLVGDAAHGFVTAPARLLRDRVPCERIIYCRSLDSLSRFAGAIGAHLGARGTAICIVDADGAIPGLIGRFVPDREPKYYKGAFAPRLGDLAYSEIALFEGGGIALAPRSGRRAGFFEALSSALRGGSRTANADAMAREIK